MAHSEHLPHSIAQVLLPWRCDLCVGIAPEGRGLCEECAGDLPTNTQACPRCARALAVTDSSGLCGHCATQPPQFHRTVAPLNYGYPVDRLLLGLKFGKRIHLARALAQQIALRVRWELERGALDMPDVLAPVPLHPRRLAERGFNQAEEIAHFIGREIGVPVRPELCRRTRNTRMQSRLNDNERHANVAGAFVCSQSPIRAAIVDDVVTTGATVEAMAGALAGAGAEYLQVWAVARA
ncbi:double zinc ribbon domain-containing protein [Candidatus Foliamicus sp.]